jgi:hypothetical protein
LTSIIQGCHPKEAACGASSRYPPTRAFLPQLRHALGDFFRPKAGGPVSFLALLAAMILDAVLLIWYSLRGRKLQEMQADVLALHVTKHMLLLEQEAR